MKTISNTRAATLFEYRRGWFDFRRREFEVKDDGIMIDTGLPMLSNERFIPYYQIEGFRYGIKWVRGFYFHVAIDFRFYFLLKDKSTIALTYRTYYGLRKKQYHQLFGEMLDAIWNRIFVRKIKELLGLLNDNKEININDVTINKDGVTIRTSGIIMSERTIIPWNELDTSDYMTYFVIFSRKDKAKINCSYRYADDWNVALLNAVVRTVLSNLTMSVEKPI